MAQVHCASESPVKRMLAAALTLAGCLAALTPAAAHHGTLISYDRNAQWTREVVVRMFHYANPHPQLFFDLTNDKGEVEQWAGEMLPNPAGLLRVGWTKARSLEALAAGQRVKLTIAPAKAGGTVGLILRVTDLDDRDIVSDSVAYPEPSAAAPASSP